MMVWTEGTYFGLHSRGSLSPEFQDNAQDAEVLGDPLQKKQDNKQTHHFKS